MHMRWWRYVVRRRRWYGERGRCIYLKYFQINFHVDSRLSFIHFLLLPPSRAHFRGLCRQIAYADSRIHNLMANVCALLRYICCLCSLDGECGTFFMWFTIIQHSIQLIKLMALLLRRVGKSAARQITTIPRHHVDALHRLPPTPCILHFSIHFLP